MLVLDGEHAPSWNNATAHQHWTKFVQDNWRVRSVVRSALSGEEKMFACPVHIRIDAWFKRGSGTDSDNIMAKLYIDALKGWLIEDDNQRCVHDVTTRAYRGDYRVIITITPVE